MKKFSGQGKLTKLIASRIALLNRNRFSRMVHDARQLKQLVERTDTNQSVALKLVSFSSLNDFPEQVLSILSFMRHVGTPLSWIIYSDGSHTDTEVKNMQDTLPFVQVIRQETDETYFNDTSLKSILKPYKQELHDFARKHFLGKRLSLYLNHAVDKPTLFLDSDIVFYKKSSLLKTSYVNESHGWFLPDQGWGCLDSRYVANRDPERYQVNAGFFLINTELTNLNDGLCFLKSIEHNYEYFSEQTVMHILLNANQYRPLDPKLFIIDTHDQFDMSYAYTPDAIAIRHYTGPVRHKMWQRDWKWQLSLT